MWNGWTSLNISNPFKNNVSLSKVDIRENTIHSEHKAMKKEQNIYFHPTNINGFDYNVIKNASSRIKWSTPSSIHACADT